MRRDKQLAVVVIAILLLVFIVQYLILVNYKSKASSGNNVPYPDDSSESVEEGEPRSEYITTLTDAEISLVHKCYWAFGKPHGPLGGKPTELAKIVDELRPIFEKKGLLWGDGKSGDTNMSNGYVEWRTMAQFLWVQLGDKFYPDIFSKKRSRVIGLPDGVRRWRWIYYHPRLIECPKATFDERCEVVDQNDTNDQFDMVMTINGKDKSQLLPGGLHFYAAPDSPYNSPEVEFKRRNELLISPWRGSAIHMFANPWVYFDPNVRQKAQTRNYAVGKSKLVAFYMTSCNKTGSGMAYLNELKKYIQVDIFGKCGPQPDACHGDVLKCRELFKKDYHFYLAFEDVSCRDYMSTEYQFFSIKNEVLPVVLGAHPADYKALSPENSYISVEDFSTPKDLAAHLLELSKNSTAYNEYFKWVGTGQFILPKIFCRLCSMLWYADMYPPNKANSKSFWNFGENGDKLPTCLSKDKWYWTRPN